MRQKLLFDDFGGNDGFRCHVIRTIGSRIRDAPKGPKVWLLSFLDASQVLTTHGGEAEPWDENRIAEHRRQLRRASAGRATRKRGPSTKTKRGGAGSSPHAVSAGGLSDGAESRTTSLDDIASDER